MRCAGHGRELRVLHRTPARPPRLSGRGDRRGRLQRHHQARRHRGRRHRRHGHGAVAVRDRGPALRRTRRHGALRQHPARTGRTRPRTGERSAWGTASSSAEGGLHDPRRVPQRGDVRPHRTRRRGQGRVGAAPAHRGAGRGRPAFGPVDAGPHRPRRRRHRGDGERVAALRGPRRRRRRGGARVQRCGGRAGPVQLPGFPSHRAAGKSGSVRSVRRRLRGRGHRAARRRASRRDQGGHRPARVEERTHRGARAPAARTASRRAEPAGAAGHGRGRPQR